ncbi:MAG: adenine-specific methyltransferase EcoRI family protein [Mycoplasmoidaceae bacterium]
MKYNKKPTEFYSKYVEGKYPKYVGTDIIKIDKFTNIPSLYKGLMGIGAETFLINYDSNQFEIVGFSNKFFFKKFNLKESKLEYYENGLLSKKYKRKLNNDAMYLDIKHSKKIKSNYYLYKNIKCNRLAPQIIFKYKD